MSAIVTTSIEAKSPKFGFKVQTICEIEGNASEIREVRPKLLYDCATSFANFAEGSIESYFYGYKDTATNRLRNFVRDWLDNHWNEALLSTKDTMESMGWDPVKIDTPKFDEIMEESFSGTIDDIVHQLIEETKRIDEKLTEDELVELLLWFLAGDSPEQYLMKYHKFACRLGSMLLDCTVNWIAEGFKKSKTPVKVCEEV